MGELSTKYPILMVHGVGFRDRKVLNYWGRIPKALTDGGAMLYYGEQDAWNDIEGNAKVLAAKIDAILQDSSASKVNIIAHSKGGMDARYLISSLGYAQKVASLTTISTPHHGSPAMDLLMRAPSFLIRFIGVFVNLWFRVLGDKSPRFYSVCQSFTTSQATQFNEQNPNSPDVLYQSYAGVMKHSRSDVLLWISHALIKYKAGENDGLVTVESAKWGNFKGVVRGQGSRGVSHADEVDIRRRNFKRKPKHNESGYYNDIRTLYVEIVRELKEQGL